MSFASCTFSVSPAPFPSSQSSLQQLAPSLRGSSCCSPRLPNCGAAAAGTCHNYGITLQAPRVAGTPAQCKLLRVPLGCLHSLLRTAPAADSTSSLAVSGCEPNKGKPLSWPLLLQEVTQPQPLCSQLSCCLPFAESLCRGQSARRLLLGAVEALMYPACVVCYSVPAAPCWSCGCCPVDPLPCMPLRVPMLPTWLACRCCTCQPLDSS